MEGAADHRVVVIGGGFGGLNAVRGLRRAPADVTLVDRQNFHLFQPLAYQVATGALSPAEIAAPLRKVVKRQANARVLLAEATDFELEHRRIVIEELANGGRRATLPYDTLIVAGGSHYSYFGHDEWQRHAPELKSMDGALDIRRRILTAFEAAELEQDPERRQRWLTFVVVGAGPTGVEMAGQIGELARDTLHRDFRLADTRTARVYLVEAADRVLTSFPERLSHSAERALEQLGATVVLSRTVVDVSGDSVSIQSPDGGIREIGTRTVVWAAGVSASGLAAALGRAAGVPLDRGGRVAVAPDLTLPGHPEVFAIGDMVTVQRPDGTAMPFPGLAPVAIQQGRYVAHVVSDRLGGRLSRPFHYVDKGNLATIGRSKAVADIKGLRLSGFPAWAFWLGVHLFYLIGFENRVLVLLRWMISFVTHGRGSRLILGAGSSGRPTDG